MCFPLVGLKSLFAVGKSCLCFHSFLAVFEEGFQQKISISILVEWPIKAGVCQRADQLFQKKIGSMVQRANACYEVSGLVETQVMQPT